MSSLASKLPGVGTTIFTTMSALALKHQAINLGQGFPDFPMDEALVNAVSRAMRNQLNQYAPMAGWMPLRERLAEKIQFLYGRSLSPDSEITITPGGTYAIYSALTAILRPGDEVIVLEPAYDSYIPNIELNGGVAIPVSLNMQDFSVDWQKVEAAITTNTRAILINSPHNPTGAVLEEEDLLRLMELVRKHSLYVISDEVYEHLIYDDKKHLSVLKYPELYQRSFACFSFGKVFHCTGWKLGYCVAPPLLTTEFRKIHQFNSFSCNTPVQAGIADYLENRETYLSLASFLEEKRDYFTDLLGPSKFSLKPSSGSYFLCAGYEKISDEPATDFAVRLTREYGIATIPVSAFFRQQTDDKLIRFCFAKKKETLAAAGSRLLAL